MGGPKSLNPVDLVVGGTIQCAEAASLGMPFEVCSVKCVRSLVTCGVSSCVSSQPCCPFRKFHHFAAY